MPQKFYRIRENKKARPAIGGGRGARVASTLATQLEERGYLYLDYSNFM
jgi:hypothetical protein